MSRLTRERSCESKAPMTRRGAKLAARVLSKKQKEHLHAYPCRFCNHWHVGHTKAKPRFDRRRLAS